MRSVLISIQPKWCELIASGKKTVEVRKTKPKLETPFKVYIYMSKSYDTLFGYGKPKKLCVDGGKVIGEFMCDRIDEFSVPYPAYFSEIGNKEREILQNACLSPMEVHVYNGVKTTCAWHISDLVIYDKPKELSEFYVWKKCNSCRDTGYESTACMYDENCKVPAVITRPPQSWCYVEEVSRR